jgi:hypothetical protein
VGVGVGWNVRGFHIGLRGELGSFYILHFTFYILHFTFCILHFAFLSIFIS